MMWNHEIWQFFFETLSENTKLGPNTILQTLLDTHVLTLSSQGGRHNVPPTVSLFVTPRVFVRFPPNLGTFRRILLQIIWFHD